nr:hypothetical protein [Micromonospora sp. DSM 115978]
LFIVATDEECANWVVTQPDGDKLSYGAYWISLEGDVPTSNRSTKTIYIPTGNRISPVSLIELCRRTAREFHLKMGIPL